MDWEKINKEAISYLQEYIKINTQNPPGDTSKTVKFFINIAKREKIFFQELPSDIENGRVNLLLSIGEPKNRLLLLNHMDVVPAQKEKWSVEPFSGEIKNGYIWGRGALDMKSMGIIELMSLIIINRENKKLKRGLGILFTCDEEMGGKLGTEWVVKNHFEKLTPEFVIDEGGNGYINVLTGDNKLFFCVSVAEKKVLWIKLKAKGKSSHASMPHNQNPNDMLINAIYKILNLNLDTFTVENSIIDELKRKITNLNPFTNAITKTTISLTSLRSGVGDPPKVNIIPDESSATLDCRLLPEVSTEDFLQLLKKTIENSNIEIEILHQPQDIKSSPIDTQLYKTIIDVIKDNYPQSQIIPILLPGATDARFFRENNITAYGFNPVILDEQEVMLLHSHNEKIAVESFLKGCRIFYEIINRFCCENS